MNEKPALVALFDGVSDASKVSSIKAAMQAIAAAHAAKAKETGEEPDLIFFVSLVWLLEKRTFVWL